jgi:ACS family hexuronate transporter-like MFS transporter
MIDIAPPSTRRPGPATIQKGSVPNLAKTVGRYRWRICGLLFVATTLNYIDRQALGLLKPTLQDPIRGIGLTEIQFAGIVAVFSAAYAIGLLVAGPFIDRVGTRIGYAVAVTVWTLGAVSHAFVTLPALADPLHSLAAGLAHTLTAVPGLHGSAQIADLGQLSGAVLGFGVARFILGLGEAGNFPAAIKATAEWFPKKERAFATGIFNSGTNIGATIAPFVIGYLVYRLPWHWAFLATSFFALVWIALWTGLYTSPREAPGLSAEELSYIESDPPEPTTRIPWSSLLGLRQTWAFVLGKALTDPIWWFYLYWLPGFLNAKYGLTITRMGLPLLIIYNGCTIGSVVGGWLPARLIASGWSLNRARKIAMLLYAIVITPIMFVGMVHSLWQAVLLISLATAAHQAWSCNLFTLVSDMFPRRAVASVVGIGSCGGSLAMMFFGVFIGIVLQLTGGNYIPVFLLAGSAYLVAIGLIHLLAPRLATAEIN